MKTEFLSKCYQGGYNVDSITSSALAVMQVINGEPPPELPPMVASDVATETVWQVAVHQSKFWKCISPKALEPTEGAKIWFLCRLLL